MRPHLEYAMQANSPTQKADIEQLKRILRFVARLVRDSRHVPYEERPRQLNLFYLERRYLQTDLILVFKVTARPKPSGTKE